MLQQSNFDQARSKQARPELRRCDLIDKIAPVSEVLFSDSRGREVPVEGTTI